VRGERLGIPERRTGKRKETKKERKKGRKEERKKGSKRGRNGFIANNN